MSAMPCIIIHLKLVHKVFNLDLDKVMVDLL